MKIISYSHRPCLILAVSLSVGIALAQTWPKFEFSIGILWLILILSYLITRKPWISWMIVQGLIMVCGVVVLNQTRLLPPDDMGNISNQDRYNLTAVEGIVNSPVVIRKTQRGIKTSFEIQIRRVKIDGVWQDRNGKILVNIFRSQNLQYGDLVRIPGKLHKPFTGSSIGHYSYDDYLKRHGIKWIFSVKKSVTLEILKHGQGHWVKAILLNIHQRLLVSLDNHLNEFEAGMVQSLVLGGKYYIPDRTRDLFVQTGTAHILAISGMNVASMAFLVFIALNVMRIPRTGQLILTSLFLVFYCLLTGSNPSVLRATIMAVVLLFGFILERDDDTLNSLGLSAVIILLLDPLTLFDVGFQLSYTGVLSIVVIYPRIYKLVDPWVNGKLAIGLCQMLCVSLAAWIGVLPLIGYYFQVITPVSVLANIPILPFVTALFMLGAGLIFVGLISPAMAGLFASCIKIVLYLLMIIVDVFSRMPLGCFFISEVKPYAIVIYYVLIAMFLAGLKSHEGVKEQPKNLHYLS